jgi:signal transduction histidine kinase
MENNAHKILLIEDNPGDALLIKTYLAEEGDRTELAIVDRLATGIDRMSSEQYDVVLLDLSLPDSAGLETLTRVQEYSEETAIIVLTGLSNNSWGQLAIQSGAQDWLEKGHIDSKSLMLSIDHAIERQQMHVKLKVLSRQLAASEERRRAIIEKNADGILLVNREGIVKFVNPAAEKILGQAPDQLLDTPIGLPIIVGEATTLDIFRLDGKEAIVEMRLVESVWKDEFVYQASLRDITEHEHIKAELAEKAAELEARNIELDEFNHTMAHQIKGLLSQIIGYSSYIETIEEISEELRTPLRQITKSGHKMNNIINELFLLSSVRRGGIEMVPLEMGKIIAEALKRLKFQMLERDCVIDQPQSWPVAWGHPAWIEEIWVNFIGNGIKYGGAMPHLELGNKALPDGMIRFWVRDNGAGITPENQKRLFKPHTRLQQTRAKGNGLGLSIVKRIVQKSGGQVGVISEPGKGSIFWFTLPEPPSQEAEIN